MDDFEIIDNIKTELVDIDKISEIITNNLSEKIDKISNEYILSKNDINNIKLIASKSNEKINNLNTSYKDDINTMKAITAELNEQIIYICKRQNNLEIQNTYIKQYLKYSLSINIGFTIGFSSFLYYISK
jgi:hypothetical protein